MRAVVITKHGGPEVLQVQERPDPSVGAGEVRIAVKAAGINFADTLARTGLYPDSPKVPCVVGYEVAGEVESVGDGVESVKPGDRVLAGTRFNGQAELVTVQENMVYKLPERLSFEEGAAFPVNYATAQAGLVVMGGLKQGERVLIHAAAGGVGISATQIAKRIGAEVFGTASASKHDAIREQGVDHAIDYRSQDYVAEVRRLTDGEGIDVAFDALGPSSFRKDYRLLRPGRAADHVRGLGGADRGDAQHADRTADACQEPILVDALVEGAGRDEREQGRLRPQHALLVGRRGKPRPGD